MKHLIFNPVITFKNLSARKKILIIIFLILCGLIIWKILSSSSKKNVYTTVKAARSTIVETVSETGYIATSTRTDIFSPTNGVVQELYVKNGDMVTSGQKLLVIKSTATEQEKTQALADYMAAKNAVDTANATLLSLQSAMFTAWDNHKTLAESDEYENSDGTPRYDKRSSAEYHIAEKNWLAAETNYKKQQAVINQAKVTLSSAYIAYQATQNAEIKATTDGTVSNLAITEGYTVQAPSPAVVQTPLLSLANLATMEATILLSENDIAKVEPEQKVILTLSALQNKKYTGIVRRADTIGTNQQGVIRFTVYIEILDADNYLHPGMKVNALITTNKVENVIAVPNAAVKPYQGKRAVRVVDAQNKIKYIPVVVGLRGKEKTEIRQGIREGQAVITSLSNDQIKRPGLFGN